MAYNTRYVFVAFTVPTAANFNNNFENTDFLKTQVDTTIINGRLTLESGVGVSTTDQTAKTTVYLTPFHGNRIGLKSGSSWDLYTFSEVSLSLSSHIKGVVYDIFAYVSSGAPVLESLAWKKVTATSSPTSGSARVITLTDTGDLAVGREVTIKDGTNSEVTTVTALVANTSITVDLTNSYTTPDIYGFNTRATDLTLDDGKWVKSGDATRRYLGSIRITTATGQCEDSLNKRLVWNAHNRVSRPLYRTDTTASWSTPSSSYTYARGQSANRIEVVVGLAENEIELRVQELLSSASASNVHYTSIGEDGLSSSGLAGYFGGLGGINVCIVSQLVKSPSIGYHYYAWLEKYTTSAMTVAGAGFSGMGGKLEM